jgi:hypothetical protein
MGQPVNPSAGGALSGGWRTLSHAFDLSLPLDAALFDWAKPKGAVLELPLSLLETSFESPSMLFPPTI